MIRELASHCNQNAVILLPKKCGDSIMNNSSFNLDWGSTLTEHQPKSKPFVLPCKIYFSFKLCSNLKLILIGVLWLDLTLIIWTN
jgi:hypothetical protein